MHFISDNKAKLTLVDGTELKAIETDMRWTIIRHSVIIPLEGGADPETNL